MEHSVMQKKIETTPVFEVYGLRKTLRVLEVAKHIKEALSDQYYKYEPNTL